MIGAGLPKRVAFQLAFSEIDDIDYVMQLIDAEMDGIPSLTETTPEDEVVEAADETVDVRVETSAEEDLQTV